MAGADYLSGKVAVTDDPFKIYLQALQSALAAGDATEHTHRPALKGLLESPILDKLINWFPVPGSQVVERESKFPRFAPWRVEEPLPWIFYQLGLLPGI